MTTSSRRRAQRRNKGKYGGMDPATRRRLEEYFELHNKRLYEYLGVADGRERARAPSLGPWRFALGYLLG